MTFSFNELCDQMSELTQEQLADEQITIKRVRPTADFDEDTFERVETLTPDDVIDAVGNEETREFRNGRWITMKVFIVRVDDTTFKPSREGKIIDSEGRKWRIKSCERVQGIREYTIRCQRVG